MKQWEHEVLYFHDKTVVTTDVSDCKADELKIDCAINNCVIEKVKSGKEECDKKQIWFKRDVDFVYATATYNNGTLEIEIPRKPNGGMHIADSKVNVNIDS